MDNDPCLKKALGPGQVDAEPAATPISKAYAARAIAEAKTRRIALILNESIKYALFAPAHPIIILFEEGLLLALLPSLANLPAAACQYVCSQYFCLHASCKSARCAPHEMPFNILNAGSSPRPTGPFAACALLSKWANVLHASLRPVRYVKLPACAASPLQF